MTALLLLSNAKRLTYKQLCWSLKDAQKAISDLLQCHNAYTVAMEKLDALYEQALIKLFARRFLHFTTNVTCYSAFTAMDFCSKEQQHVGLDQFDANIRFMEFPGKGKTSSSSPGKENELTQEFATGQVSRICVERVMKFARMFPNEDADQIMERVNNPAQDPQTPPLSDDDMGKE